MRILIETIKCEKLDWFVSGWELLESSWECSIELHKHEVSDDHSKYHIYFFFTSILYCPTFSPVILLDHFVGYFVHPNISGSISSSSSRWITIFFGSLGVSIHFTCPNHNIVLNIIFCSTTALEELWPPSNEDFFIWFNFSYTYFLLETEWLNTQTLYWQIKILFRRK